jgi:hypothetical protein
MTTKEIAIKSIHELPEDAAWGDIRGSIDFVACVRRGLRELDEGKGIPREKVREEFSEWLSSRSGLHRRGYPG